MSKAKLIKSGFIYTLGSLLIQGLAFITLPIYTRTISQEVFGQYSLYMSWVSLVTLVIGLQTVGSLNIAKVKYSEDYERYSAHALTVSSLFAGIVLIVVYLGRKLLADWLDFDEMIILLLVLQGYFTYVSSFLGQYYIQLQKATLNFLFSAFSAISSVALSLYFIFDWNDDFMARLLGAFIPMSVMSLFTFGIIYSKGKTILERRYIGFTLSVSLPLIFHHLGHQILNQMDRIMIGKLMTATDVAMYSFGYNLGMLISLVLMNLNTAWTPWFFEQKKSQNPLLPSYIYRYLAIAMFLTMGYLTIYPELALVMGGDNYAESIGFIPLIIVSYFVSFLYTFPVNIQFYYANTKMIPIGTLLAGGINILLNLLLIPLIGIYGAAVATVVSYVALLAFHHLISKKKYAYTDVSVKTYLILSSLVTGYAVMMSMLSNRLVLRWLLGLLVVAGYVLYFKSDLILLTNKIVKRGKKDDSYLYR